MNNNNGAFITKEYLREHKDEIFVFGDNNLRYGKGGSAKLRDESNTYGFITKKAPNNNEESFYKRGEYEFVYQEERNKLMSEIKNNSDKLFLISKVGAGLANRYGIFEDVIEKNIKKDLESFRNVKFLW